MFFEPIFCPTAVMALSTARKRPATSPPPRIKPVSTAAADTPSAPTESAIVESAQVGETEERLALDMMVMLVVLRWLASYELRDPDDERAGRRDLPKQSTIIEQRR